MLNRTFAAIYRRQRKMTGFTQRQLARMLRVGRSKIQKIEAGRARLDPDTEARLTELARCSKIQLIEIYCEELSREIEMTVAIAGGRGGYRPATEQAKANVLLETHGNSLSEETIRELSGKIDAGRYMEMALQKHNAELAEATRRAYREIGIDGSKDPR